MAAAAGDDDRSERQPLLQRVPSEAAAGVDTTQIAPEAQDDSSKERPPIGYLQGSLIIFAVGLLVFLQSSNISLLTTTQSAIAEDLDAYEQTSWFASAFLIAASSISPFAGRLSQLFSPRICMTVASLLFATGAVICGTSNKFAVFILGRVIMGLGCSGIFIISMVLVLHLTRPERRGLFIGLVNTGYTAGVSLGAIIAGALLPKTGWRFVFWLQAPLALLCATCIYFCIPKSQPDVILSRGKGLGRKLARIDYLGVTTMTASLVLLLVSLSAPKILIPHMIISLILGVLFIFIEFRVAVDPVIPTIVFKSRGILLSCVATLGLMMSRWVVLFYTPVFGIAVRGWALPVAGSLLLPSNGGFALGGVIVGWLHLHREGDFYISCLVVAILFALTFIILSQLTTTSASVPAYVLTTFANGVFTGASLNYTLAHVLHLSPPNLHIIVVSLLGTFRGFSASFGSAIGGGIFSRVLGENLNRGFKDRGILKGKEELIHRLLGSPALVNQLGGVEREVAVQGYAKALRSLFVAAGIFAGVMIFVQAGTGWKAPKTSAEETEEQADEQSHTA